MKTQRQRKIQRKTDYKKRVGLLKSEKPRAVLRRTNKYALSQYVESHEAQDKIIFQASSKELLKAGWPENAKGSLKNIPAFYLTGYLMGKKIQKQKLEEPVVDLGMLRTLHKTRVFAFIKGLIDSGIKIECKDEAFPEEDRIKGTHLKNKVDVEKIKSGLDKL